VQAVVPTVGDINRESRLDETLAKVGNCLLVILDD
jgi:hypothetical protein